MKLSSHRSLWRALVSSIVIGAVVGAGYLGMNSRAQGKTPLPARTGYVNDFAQVVDDTTRQRLETILDNLKKRSGIELNLATVQTTGNQDIFAFSRQLAGDWGIGSRGSSRKTLLLVVSVDEKAVFTQLSRSVQGELPEGILGELNQRVRGPISSGHFSQGLTDGVDHFIAALAKKVGFSVEDIDQSQSAASTASVPVSDPSPTEPTNHNVIATPVKTVANQEVPPSSTRPRFAVPSTTPSTTQKESGYTWMSPTGDESEEVELTLTLPLPERIVKLKEFLEAYPNSTSKPRAIELLISTYAGLGDQKLKNGDSVGGIEQLMLAINEAPANVSDMLFSGVVSQIPLNLFIRGERNAAIEAAQKIETKFGADPKRLLTLAGFYLGIEDGIEAARLAAEAVKLTPELAEAHYVLARALHISLRLDEAAAEYKRALELDPNSKKGTRRSLADLNRAAGKAEEALELYREQLRAEPTDKAARAGAVLSLLELGRFDEGNKELAATLQEDPRNLALLSGTAYWFAAHNEAERSLDLARKAVQLEPRYTWSQIALARALIGNKRPMDAERALRFARQYGNFPTLDYELANVLSAAGLYEEAAEVLLQSFTFKDDKIETRLAGRVPAKESDFNQLLAPERRAAIFQFAAADNKNDAAILKALLAFATATNQPDESVKLDEVIVAGAAKEFASGTDDMRVYRQLYASGVLIRKGAALQTAFELTEAARSSIESALEVPAATVAAQAEELRDIRARAIAKGNTPDIADAPRNILANILRGRVEDSAGWALYNQGKTDEAIEHLKLAVGILPEGIPLSRNTLWHLGAALDQAGNKAEALGYYIKSYNSGDPDPGRLTVIEQLYQKTNGSLDGLDQRIGATNRVASSVSLEPAAPGVDKPVAVETPSPSAHEPQAAASPESTPTPSSVDPPSAVPVATQEARPVEGQASPTPTPTEESPVQTPAASPEPTPRSGLPDVVKEMKVKPRATVKLTGTVRDANNALISNVVVVLISPRGSVLATTTDTDGNYSFIVSPSSLSYRIIPSKDGYVFEPVDRVIAVLEDDQKAVDFIGKALQKP
ncbi:MAG: TPM domain-containing protein [Pyrinomonadaceae bacterium]|nr:TPM domain-containing protein [Pyrinomonadaceae bacterium]